MEKPDRYHLNQSTKVNIAHNGTNQNHVGEHSISVVRWTAELGQITHLFRPLLPHLEKKGSRMDNNQFLLQL